MSDRELTRARNRAALLASIRASDGISQSDLARASQLQASTVSYAVRELRERGLVRTIGRGATGAGGGKPSTLVGADPTAGYYLGLLLRQGSCAIARVDFAGAFADERTVPITATTGEMITATVASLAGDYVSSGTSPLLGVGIAVASVVENDGSISPSAHFPVALTGLAERIQAALPDKSHPQGDVPIVCENDANCIALDAFHDTDAGHVLSVVFSDEPATVGTGLVIGGSVYRGSGGTAGELLPAEDHDDPSRVVPALDIVVRFADPDLVVVAHDLSDSAWKSVEDGIAEFRRRTVLKRQNPRAAIAGATLLAYESSLPILLDPSRSAL